jgi:hypothetical protein
MNILAAADLYGKHGHLHSGSGRDGRHFNVAALPQGRAMLIDLDLLTHRIIELTRA